MEYNKIQNMLLGIAIGDAFGAAYEFLAGGRRVIAENLDMTCYSKNPSDYFKHTAGRYTDDTQMSIGICELLLSGKKFNLENLADSFVSCYKRDPAVGYSKRFDFLATISTGKELIERIDAKSEGNGAAMRAIPIGLLADPERVFEYSLINARLTHDTPIGLASSVSVALASHYYIHNVSGKSLFDFVLPYCERVDGKSAEHLRKIESMASEDHDVLFGDLRENKGVPCEGMKTAGAVFFLLKKYDSNPFELLRQAVLLGGDTDSVASISMGLFAINSGLSDLPRFLFDGLTNHAYGRDYLLRLGEDLCSKFC
jgi:ADP-ribosyl-[dinitrogen reductase] hydrolase